MNTLGDRIRILRSGRALTQQAVAEALGVSRSAVAMWEKDEREPNLETLAQLAKLLDVPLSALVEREEAPMPENLRPVRARRIPLLGAIAAGEPIFAEEEHETYVDVGGSVRADFALEVQGREHGAASTRTATWSTSAARTTCSTGRWRRWWWTISATLKRVYHLPIGVQLMPINPAFAPMLFTAENSDSVRILGLAVGYFRSTRLTRATRQSAHFSLRACKKTIDKVHRILYNRSTRNARRNV